jgi:aspartate dehydrogenase
MIDVSVLGLGAVGATVARAIGTGRIPGLRLVAASAANQSAAKEKLSAMMDAPPPVLTLQEARDIGDLVVECLPPALFRETAETVLGSGRAMVAVSVGALLEHSDLIELARTNGGTLHIPSGAIAGLDAVRAAAEGDVQSVELTTCKPPSGFQQSPYLDAKGIDLTALNGPTVIYEGTATEGVRLFPKNVNVVAALSLAGIGPERTRLRLLADPSVTRNSHSVTVHSDATHLSTTIENLPDPGNPRTSMITALSVVSLLRGIAGPLRF